MDDLKQELSIVNNKIIDSRDLLIKFLMEEYKYNKQKRQTLLKMIESQDNDKK